MHVIVYLVLTWIRYFISHEICLYSPQEKIIVEFIKMTPFKSLSDSYSRGLQVPIVQSFKSHNLFGCPAFLNPFQQWLYDFEILLFTLRTTEGLKCTYYRRFKLLNRMEMCKWCGDVYIFLILPIYIYFFNWYCPSEATEKLHVSQKTK